MLLAQLNSISMRFGAQEVLGGLTFSLSTDTRLALTGANGSGKTTLMRIIAGFAQPDGGNVTIPRGVRISYLPQSGLVHNGRSLWDEAEQAYSRIRELITRHERLGEDLAALTEGAPETDRLLHEFHDIQEHIVDSGYYSREAEIHSVLTGLGFEESQFGDEVSTFSGGWQMRIGLAKVLLERANLLLLDEPTNYLDIEARFWLRDYLCNYDGGYIVVSHDRYFLDETVTEVAELFMGELHTYRGNFTEYQAKREKELEQLLKSYEEQQREIAHIEEFIRRFRYNASKAPMVQSRVKQLEKIRPIEIPESMKQIHFSFPPPPHSGKQVLELTGITRRYGENLVLDGLDLHVERGEKIVIAGKNGAGKTTLLRLIGGHDSGYSGTMKFGSGVRLAYFSQDNIESLDPGRTVMEEVEESAPTSMIPHLRGLLGAFLFRGDAIHKQLGVLSGGEASRVALVKMLLQPANLLILDEPTNHLDMSSKDVLLDALTRFPGTVLFVSHDRYFIRDLATRVVELRRLPGSPPEARNFPGDYDYYLWRTEQEAAAEEGSSGFTATPTVRPAGEPDGNGQSAQEVHEATKKRRSALLRLEREEARLLSAIEASEGKQAALVEKLASPEVYTNGELVKEIQEEIRRCEAERQALTERWESLEAERAEVT